MDVCVALKFIADVNIAFQQAVGQVRFINIAFASMCTCLLNVSKSHFHYAMCFVLCIHDIVLHGFVNNPLAIHITVLCA